MQISIISVAACRVHVHFQKCIIIHLHRLVMSFEIMDADKIPESLYFCGG